MAAALAATSILSAAAWALRGRAPRAVANSDLGTELVPAVFNVSPEAPVDQPAVPRREPGTSTSMLDGSGTAQGSPPGVDMNVSTSGSAEGNLGRAEECIRESWVL